MRKVMLLALAMTFVMTMSAHADSHKKKQWIVYPGGEGPGKGKHVVLISGDEEYRSEEALPQLGKILSKHHGFQCTVTFAIDPNTGLIDPNNGKNIPGLEALKTADLMIIATRFRDLPDDQMKHIDDYLKAGKPVIGMRTATHAFNIGNNKTYSHYSWRYNGEKKEWKNGFGKLVLGETWVNHHGGHKRDSCRGVIDKGAAGHPITRGLKDGDVWGPSDTYGVHLPLPGDSKPIIRGQVVLRPGKGGNDVFYGMKPTDTELVKGKNDPVMPVGWTKSYHVPGGKKGKAFNTTMGASTDLVADGTRRMIVNAAYWCLGMEIPAEGTKVDIVGEFKPTRYEFRRGNYWKDRKMKLSEHEMKN